jgi:hypothetical protein
MQEEKDAEDAVDGLRHSQLKGRRINVEVRFSVMQMLVFEYNFRSRVAAAVVVAVDSEETAVVVAATVAAAAVVADIAVAGLLALLNEHPFRLQWWI